MAAAASFQVNLLSRPQTSELNTLADPRAPSPAPKFKGSPADSVNHPDLSNEVAALSTKLINAINHQTALDDALQGTRHELEAARQRIAQVESEVVDEQRKRNVAERDKRGMEQELENLTSTLFEEANGMVSSARREHDASEKRADQLKARLQDTETLLASHQEQLRELKTVLEHMQTERDQTDGAQATAPSTPMIASYENVNHQQLDLHGQPIANGTFNPEHPLHYSYLVQPVMRTDLSAYEDFISLLKTSRTSSSHSRGPSGNFSGLNVKGLGALNYSNSSLFGTSSAPAADPGQPLSTPTSNPTSFNSSAAPSTPFAPGVFAPSSPQNDTSSPLKDSRFYKRVLTEDIEPTLRLDVAPSLSFLSRRTVLSTMASGTLIVEPLPPVPNARPGTTAAAYAAHIACSLCGELRRGKRYLRKHRFRTSEADDAQKYPLCDHCVVRLRAVCDFVGFLRAIRAGFWRGDGSGSGSGAGVGDDESSGAWEECVRLRERMFWARLGGGVVPAGANASNGTHASVAPTGSGDTATPTAAGTPRESLEGWESGGGREKSGQKPVRVVATDTAHEDRDALPTPPPPPPAKDESPRTPADRVFMSFEPVPVVSSPNAESQRSGVSMPGSFD